MNRFVQPLAAGAASAAAGADDEDELDPVEPRGTFAGPEEKDEDEELLDPLAAGGEAAAAGAEDELDPIETRAMILATTTYTINQFHTYC